jgi:hypothetical protein
MFLSKELSQACMLLSWLLRVRVVANRSLLHKRHSQGRQLRARDGLRRLAFRGWILRTDRPPYGRSPKFRVRSWPICDRLRAEATASDGTPMDPGSGCLPLIP